ncbi:uncharacterized protein LOC123910091 [Trifolium pratense]|uniref:uncharacterized protein LOC123910091 n=1 Tax=Trifolium pratense TaxID=57577 RepID=UPI001E690FD2|nr:uncharacterized protein LOC123910091 [Trifolium pratense]
MHHRKVCASAICPRCLVTDETIDHCLFSCIDAFNVWKACGLDNISPPTHGLDWFSWCKTFGASHGNIIFVVLWVIWCARNDVIFNNNRTSIYKSVAKIHSMLHYCAVAFDTPTSVAANMLSQQLVAWPCPPNGYVCLNVDGSLLGSPQSAGFGGLIRNSFGSFLGGFYGVACQAIILYAEIMAMLHGLELCWDKGFKHVICLSDSLQTVTLVKTGTSPHHKFANEVFSIRQLLDRD